MRKLVLALAIGFVFASSALAAGPVALSEAQMDQVTAGSAEKVSAFVCPVILSQAVGDNNPQASELGTSGTYTVVPATANNADLYVPAGATNADGTGIPGDLETQAAPGDPNYTAIWGRQ
jgi:hypothetical protein